VNSQGYSLFRDLADDFGFVSCDNLIINNASCRPYAYHHVLLQNKSFTDHVFISQDLKSRINDFTILGDALNISDHLPVVFFSECSWY
jgi:hypothetical protein